MKISITLPASLAPPPKIALGTPVVPEIAEGDVLIVRARPTGEVQVEVEPAPIADDNA